MEYELRVSLMDWVFRTEEIKQSNKLSCLKKVEGCVNDCINVDFEKIKDDFGIECKKFDVFRVAGIVVN
jgi:hypothetical protein